MRMRAFPIFMIFLAKHRFHNFPSFPGSYSQSWSGQTWYHASPRDQVSRPAAPAPATEGNWHSKQNPATEVNVESPEGWHLLWMWYDSVRYDSDMNSWMSSVVRIYSSIYPAIHKPLHPSAHPPIQPCIHLSIHRPSILLIVDRLHVCNVEDVISHLLSFRISRFPLSRRFRGTELSIPGASSSTRCWAQTLAAYNGHVLIWRKELVGKWYVQVDRWYNSQQFIPVEDNYQILLN